MSTRDRGWAEPNLCSCPHPAWGQGTPKSSQTQRQKVPLGGPTKGSGPETRLRAEEATKDLGPAGAAVGSSAPESRHK